MPHHNTIHEAVLMDDMETLSSYLNSPEIVNAQDEDGMTPLMLTMENNDSLVLNRLLEAGADIELTDLSGKTALVWAVIYENDSAVDTLLVRKAKVNSVGKEGWPPLIWAVTAENLGMVEKLLDAGAEVNIEDRYQRTPLLFAAQLSKTGTEILKLLVSRGAKLDSKDEHGATALIAAINTGNYGAVELLLEAGASVKAAEIFGTSAFTIAKCLNKDIAELIRKYTKIDDFCAESSDDENSDHNGGKPSGIELGATTEPLISPVPVEEIRDLKQKLIENTHEVKKLKQQVFDLKEDELALSGSGTQLFARSTGVRRERPTAAHNTSITKLEHEIVPVVNELAENRKMLARENEFKSRKFKLENAAQVIFLLANRVHGGKHMVVKKRDPTMSGKISIIDELIGGLVNAKSIPGSRILAFLSEKLHIIDFDLRRLTMSLCEGRLLDSGESTKLIEAAEKGDNETVEALLIEYSAEDLNIQNHKGWTALMFAAANGHADIVRKLISLGANTKCQADDESTALILAVQRGHMPVLNFLIEAEPKPFAKVRGKSAYDFAREAGHHEIAAVLSVFEEEDHARHASLLSRPFVSKDDYSFNIT